MVMMEYTTVILLHVASGKPLRVYHSQIPGCIFSCILKCYFACNQFFQAQIQGVD